jgi:hypothetical protein
MVIRTCEQRVANRDSIIAAQNQKIRAQARLIPDRWDRGKEWILRLGFFGLGVLTSK